MNKITVYYAEFWSPGLVFGESFQRDMTTPDPKLVEWPERAYAFTIHERTDAHDGAEVFKGKSKQIGPMYYHPDSSIETLEQVKKRRPNESTLIANMECNRWDKIIWTRWGNWPQPYDEKKVQLLSK